MKAIFISQPMGGRSDKEIASERAEVASYLLKRFGPFQLLDTHFTYKIGSGHPLEYLGESIKYLSQADVAVFCKGWESHSGCRIEMECCKAYNIPVIELR